MKTKLTEFISRNKKRNSHLYNTDLIIGIDYLICPVSNERMSMIKSSYIEKVLGMSVDSYDSTYPGIRGICSKRKENIKAGLKQIDPASGLTKYEVGQVKARAVLSKVDDLGMRGYDRKGQKTRATHMANIDSLGRNGYRRQADARLSTVLPNGLTVEQNAHIKQKETLLANHKTGAGGASKVSKKVLAPIIELLNAYNIKYYFDREEYGIKCADTGNYYFYDLTIPEFNIAIEYQSTAWHSNPSWDSIKWDRWKPPRGKIKTADEALQYDYTKAKSLYKFRNIITYYVWEDSAIEDIRELLCLLKTQTTKY